jgi:hypothetical protein
MLNTDTHTRLLLTRERVEVLRREYAGGTRAEGARPPSANRSTPVAAPPIDVSARLAARLHVKTTRSPYGA